SAIASRSCGLPWAVGYPCASVAARSASWTTAGVASTGVPMDRSAIPPGWARARSAYGARWSQGYPSSSGANPTRSFLRRQGGDERMILVDQAQHGSPAGGTDVVAQLHIG